MFDYLIVGAGFAGSVLAERLASQADKRVLVVERRGHIGGNAYDCYDEAGILIHKYGPHIFHTNSLEVFEYLSQFTSWRPYQHRVLASVAGQLLPIPINLDTINRLYGTSLTSFEVEAFFASVAEPRDPIVTSEDVVISRVGRELYEKFFKHYTRKQWGLDPSELDAAVTSRVPVRTDRDDRYFTDRYQAMPLHGFTRMFERMLAHPNVKLMLNADYREVRDIIPHRELDLHRTDRRVLRVSVWKTTVSIARVSVRDAGPADLTARGGGELPERLRLHTRYGVQASDGPGASKDDARDRVSAG